MRYVNETDFKYSILTAVIDFYCTGEKGTFNPPLLLLDNFVFKSLNLYSNSSASETY